MILGFDKEYGSFFQLERSYIMATVKPPKGETPPLCKCGCGECTNWGPGKGWHSYLKGHYARNKPGTRLGVKLSEETRRRMSESQRARCKGSRLRDHEENPGRGVYATHEYREARERLVEGKPCIICGTFEDVCAHHEIPGDDESLVPVCRKHHPTLHAAPGAHGQEPPSGEQPPICECGCGLEVRWKRHRGWAKYRKGHGCAIVPAGTKHQKPPLCKCGCGDPVKFTHGKGWNEYKTGHRQRIEGAAHKRPHPPAPLCKCGCGQKVEWVRRSGYPVYIPGHRKSTRGRHAPEGEQAPLCKCGCGNPVVWSWGNGWCKWVKGHRGKKVV